MLLFTSDCQVAQLGDFRCVRTHFCVRGCCPNLMHRLDGRGEWGWSLFSFLTLLRDVLREPLTCVSVYWPVESNARWIVHNASDRLSLRMNRWRRNRRECQWKDESSAHMQKIFHDTHSVTSCTFGEHRGQKFLHVLFHIDYSTRAFDNHSVCDRYRENKFITGRKLHLATTWSSISNFTQSIARSLWREDLSSFDRWTVEGRLIERALVTTLLVVCHRVGRYSHFLFPFARSSSWSTRRTNDASRANA